MRFIAPERDALPDRVFEQPLFADIEPELLALCRQAHWPEPESLNAFWPPPVAAGAYSLRFIAQDDLDDGAHYETRIFESGAIATRRDNWHDLFNAVVWLRNPCMKAALNRRQAEDIRRFGTRERTRAQCALTHFDEAGAVLRLDDAGMLSAWDTHDWPALFAAWDNARQQGRVQLRLFGHSLYEHALNPAIALVAKALVIDSRHALGHAEMDALVAQAIEARRCLNDPQELRPIPLSGIPGWHPEHGCADFFERQPCFRPKRAGKIYPEPLRVC